MRPIRINQIEIKKTKYKDSSYEIIGWYKNDHYQQWDNMLAEGWMDTGGFLTKNHLSIHESCFKNPETCYVIAWLKKDSGGYYLESVGSRILQLNEEEFKDFMDIYRKADKKLNK